MKEKRLHLFLRKKTPAVFSPAGVVLYTQGVLIGVVIGLMDGVTVG